MNSIDFLSTSPSVQRLGWTLIHFLWQGALVAVLLAGFRGLFGRSLTVHSRYIMSCLALGAMVLAPLGTFASLGADYQSPLKTVNWAALSSSAAGSLGGITPGSLPWQAVWHQTFPWVVVAWALGTAIFSIRFLGGCLHANKLRTVATLPAPSEWHEKCNRLVGRIGVSYPVRLMLSSAVQIPVVVGWLRPVILLPVGAMVGLSAGQMESLLAHELAHIRRHDYLINVLQGIAETILFYHPAVWWISAQIRLERELCCDDVAVKAHGDVFVYASALAELEMWRARQIQGVLAANGGSLVARIRRLLENSETRADFAPASSAAMLLSTLLLVAIGAVLAHAAPQRAAQQDAPGVLVDPGDRSVTLRSPVEYPREAVINGIQGTIEIIVDVDPGGNVTDARVQSGPPELRNVALSSVLKWRFAGTGSVTSRRINISFTSPNSAAAAAVSHTAIDVQGRREKREQLSREGTPANRAAIEGEIAALDFSLSSANALQGSADNVAGRWLHRIQAQGLSAELLDEMRSAMPVRVGALLSSDLIALMESAAQQRGIAVHWVPLNNNEADLLIGSQVSH